MGEKAQKGSGGREKTKIIRGKYRCLTVRKKRKQVIRMKNLQRDGVWGNPRGPARPTIRVIASRGSLNVGISRMGGANSKLWEKGTGITEPIYNENSRRFGDGRRPRIKKTCVMLFGGSEK